ncbi:MAG: hypothetical protein ACK5KL_11890 [Dysgonomonas sp.]
MSGIVDKSTKKVSDYRTEINKLQTDANKLNTYEGVMELLNKKSAELENQRGWVEDIRTSTTIPDSVKRDAIDKLKEIEAEYDILTDKVQGFQDERAKAGLTTDTPSTPTGDGDKASVQRKKVQDALRKLEIENNEEIIRIKKSFRDNDVKSESEHNAQLLAQQDKYDQARKDKLNSLKSEISDVSIREDMQKQITEIDNKALDREIKRQAELKKILLSADPTAAEKEAYENRLRELGLFGIDREKLTKEQLSALELLEKQHQEKMSKIERPEVLKQLKKINEEQAKEEQARSQLRSRGLMSEQRYQHELLLLDIAYTAQKLQIDGLTEEQRIQLQRESFDKQRKLYEENSEIQERLNKNKKPENLKEAEEAELAFFDQLFDDKLKQTETYEQARLAIIQKYALLEQEQNEQKQKRMLEVASFALDSLQTLMSSYSSYVQAENEAETAAINKKYDAQIKAAGNNSKQVKRLEEQRDKELAEVNRKNEERSFNIQIAMAIASTAQAAINAYSSAAAIPVVGFTLAPIAAATATAAGLLQVAAIRKQHEAAMAQYWTGGFTPQGPKYGVAGNVHYGEFVANKEAISNPELRPFFDVVDMAQRNNTVSSLKASDFATAMEYREKISFYAPAQPAVASAQTDTPDDDYLISVLGQVVEVLSLLDERLENPLEARTYIKGRNGIQEALSLAERMDKNVKRS